MSGEPIETDRIVQTMLQLLPIPDHEAGFWSEMEARLTAEPPPAWATPPLQPATPTGSPVTGELPVLTLVDADHRAVVPSALRRRSNALLGAVAAVAAVVVVIAGATLVRQRSTTDDTETAGADVTTTTRASATSDADTLAAAAGDPAAEAVLTWVRALDAGDLDAAWDALGPASQAHWGSEDAFAEERSGLAEGYGAWAGTTPDAVLVTRLTSSGDGDVVIVTLVGTVEQEGVRQHRADAFAVRTAKDTAVLELYASAGPLEIVVPELLDDAGARGAVDQDAAIVVVVPEGAEAPVLSLDGADPIVCGEAPGSHLTALEQTSGQRCEWRPEGGLRPGERVLTVGCTSSDGREISAQSVLFDAA